MVLAGRSKLRVSKNFLRGDIFLYLLNIFAIAVPKLKQKNIKKYSSILATVNHWNWLDDSSPLKQFETVFINFGVLERLLFSILFCASSHIFFTYTSIDPIQLGKFLFMMLIY